MKKNALPLLGLFSLPLFALAPQTLSAVNADEQVDYSAAFRLPYNVTGTATLTTEYPAGLESLNTVVEYSVDRDYGQIEVDGTVRDAVRDNSGASSTIHYEGLDGTSYHDTLNYLNVLESISDSALAMDVVFSSTYGDPWDYIDVFDFSGTTLSSAKAEYLLERYFGLAFPVVSATVVPNEEYPEFVDGIEFVCGLRPEGIEIDGNGNIINAESSLEVSLSFAFTSESFERLSPGSEDNPELEQAVAALGENYTAIVYESDLDISIAYYYVGDALYIHNDAIALYPVEGDVYIETMSETRDRSYTYTGGRWVSGGYSNTIASLLPKFSAIAPELFEKVSNSTYALSSNAYGFISRDVVPEKYGLSEIEPYYASCHIEGGVYSSMSLGYYDANFGPYSITASYGEVGTTEMPLWLVAPGN